MVTMRVVVLNCALVVGLVGCFSPTPKAGAPCGMNRECPDGLECSVATDTCEKPGTGPDANVIDACPDNACVGDMLVGCGTMVACANGCGGTTPHCLTLAPSNGLNATMLVGATADVTLDKLNFDAGDGSIKMMSTDIRAAGTGVKSGIRWEVVNGVSVWTANTWTLSGGNEWSFSGTRPVALFANSTITISGALGGLNATGSVGAVGGTSSNASTVTGGCLGRAGRVNDGNHAEGGGGGGGGDNLKGGNGGPSNFGGVLTGVGGMCATRPTTIPLVAGNAGGASGGAPGGGGGGAIALVAMDSVIITTNVSTSGAGGSNLGSNGGGGGGGGGAIFIEAPNVSISGQLTANGGGGGAPGGGTLGNDGATTSSNVAQGGTYSGSGGPARGGNGAAGVTQATNGNNYNFDSVDPVTMVVTNFNRGGGGGGGYGKIEVKRKTGGVSGLASPAAAITNAVFE